MVLPDLQQAVRGFGTIDEFLTFYNDRLGALLERAHRRLATCPCVDGCPACIHLPHCRLGNEPLVKDLACDLVAQLTTA